MRSILVCCLLLAGCATAPPRVTADPVVAAERAFAADAAARGWIPAFRASTAPDGVVLEPDPVSAPETYAAMEDDGNKTLQWWPAYAGIARSGDLGFTTGPYVFAASPDVRGHYFTVWRRQGDGTWKWVFDGGVRVVDADPIARDADPPALPISARGAGAAATAIGEVTALEERLADGPLSDYLAEDARVNRAGAAPAIGRDAAAVFAPVQSAFPPLRTDASSAGDLVFTLGEARWTADGAARRGHYARIWQLRAEGWRIVFDELIPRPPPPPG